MSRIGGRSDGSGPAATDIWERVDHRSLEAQRDDAVAATAKLDRNPDIRHGRSAWIEARGQAAERLEAS
ncbi:MAG: hypothetical protein J4F34_09450 [Gemmatimonadetes bacterium]|nr:hypothetical protein [Gemmatimonadota bacterium]